MPVQQNLTLRLRVSALASLGALALVSIAGCETAAGNNLKPVALESRGQDLVIVVPLCPGERLDYVAVRWGKNMSWQVEGPRTPTSQSIVVRDDSAYATVRNDDSGPIAGLVEVSIDTNFDTHERLRFQNQFDTTMVDSALNGGDYFDNKAVNLTDIKGASNCGAFKGRASQSVGLGAK
jgi:hypothetical protein